MEKINIAFVNIKENLKNICVQTNNFIFQI